MSIIKWDAEYDQFVNFEFFKSTIKYVLFFLFFLSLPFFSIYHSFYNTNLTLNATHRKIVGEEAMHNTTVTTTMSL